jgi:outer membrane protein assembly factor BamA
MRLLIALALAGCSTARTIPPAPPVPAAVVSPESTLAHELVITGNHALSTTRLRTDLAKAVCDVDQQIDLVLAASAKGEDVAACGSPEAYRIGVEMIYLSEGFPEAKASLVNRRGRTTIVVAEGPRYRLSTIVTVDQAGSDSLGDAGELSRVIALAPGEPFSRDRIRAAVRRVMARYTDAGYKRANVTPLVSLDTTNHRVDLTLEIERGER